MPAVGQKTERLIHVLGEMADLLESDGERNWQYWARGARSMLMQGDYSAISYVRTAYGGMGTLNDLVLGQTEENGVWTWKPGYRELNDRFDHLRGQAWELTDDIKELGTLG
jgi:hypothetical protein